MSPPERRRRGTLRQPQLSVAQALALGALHGPAELLPISSSGHLTLVPWLLEWDYEHIDDELRKSFEVALHAGTAAALLLTLRHEVGGAVRDLDARRLLLIALSFAPPAAVGYTLERPIERHLGTPGHDRRRFDCRRDRDGIRGSPAADADPRGGRRRRRPVAGRGPGMRARTRRLA